VQVKKAVEAAAAAAATKAIEGPKHD